MLHTYKTNDYEFGIDTKIVAILIGGDQDWANEIVEKFAADGSSMCACTLRSSDGCFT